ncbi:helix-turn-helix domain-containing protein [Thauera humireducens]|uniref:helix-turn-helix domain-containing protein n=1 Tax=Thauera humireducens TaxID=1134435 RepID=UPI00311F9DBD
MAETSLSGIDRTLQILQQIATSETPLNAREISQALAIPLSSVYRHLVSLQRWGLIGEAGGDGRHSAGPLSLQLALRYQNDAGLSTLARPLLMRLAKQSRETVALMVATHFQAICIDLIESQQALRCAFAPGKASPWFVAPPPRRCWRSCPHRNARMRWSGTSPHRPSATGSKRS